MKKRVMGRSKELQGSYVVTWRKMLTRQSLGYQYVPVMVNYQFETLELAAYKDVGSDGEPHWRFVENSTWYNALVQLVTFCQDQDYLSKPERQLRTISSQSDGQPRLHPEASFWNRLTRALSASCILSHLYEQLSD